MKKEELKNKIFETMTEWKKTGSNGENLHRLYATEEFADELTKMFTSDEDSFTQSRFNDFARNIFIDLALDQVGNKECKIWSNDFEEKVAKWIFFNGYCEKTSYSYSNKGFEEASKDEDFQRVTKPFIEAIKFLKGELK